MLYQLSKDYSYKKKQKNFQRTTFSPGFGIVIIVPTKNTVDIKKQQNFTEQNLIQTQTQIYTSYANCIPIYLRTWSNYIHLSNYKVYSILYHTIPRLMYSMQTSGVLAWIIFNFQNLVM